MGQESKQPTGDVTRRRLLQRVGGAVVAGTVGAVGLAGAQQTPQVTVEPKEVTVNRGESFTITITIDTPGCPAGTECAVVICCWTFAVQNPETGEWRELATENNVDGDAVCPTFAGRERTMSFSESVTVPPEWGAGTFTVRVSLGGETREGEILCPEPGSTENQFWDITVHVRESVEVKDVSFRGCSEVWVAFEKFPVESTPAQVNINGNWKSITITKDELTKIPGQYGHDTPVYKHRVHGNDKIVGLKIAGNTYTNTNNCAKNV